MKTKGFLYFLRKLMNMVRETYENQVSGMPNQLKSKEFKWDQVKSSELKWNQMTSNDFKWNQVKSKEFKWNHVEPTEF